MPLYRHTKVPPPPELGTKTIWQYLPRQSVRRVLLLLLTLGAVLFIRSTGGGAKVGGLLDFISGSPGAGPASPTGADPAAPVYHIKVTGPQTPPPKSAP
jgi:hypothetical protein